MTDFVFEHLKALRDFSGRETRAQFWPFVAAVYLGLFAAMVVIMIAGDWLSDGFPSMEQTIYVSGFAAILGFLCLASAVTRRLHDRGLSGAWGLMPVPFLIFALYTMSGLFATFGRPMPNTLFSAAIISTLLYDLTLIILIFLLIAPSDEGENRFGPSPRDLT